MDIKIEKKPWYIRYKFYIAGGIAFVAFLVYVIILSAGPRKLRIESENIQIAEVKDDKFMEYVDVEGLIQPILAIKVNTREAGSVERIIAEEGSLLQKGDTILTLSNPDLLRSIEDQRGRLGEATHHLSGERNRNGTEKPEPETTDAGNQLRTGTPEKKFHVGQRRIPHGHQE